MAKVDKRKSNPKVKGKNKNKEKYNAENEIIIGVTTRPKEVRVDKKKSTRANSSSKNVKRTSSKKKQKKVNSKPKKVLTKDQEIKKSNRKKIILSFSILIVIMLGVAIYLLTTPMFNIVNIEVLGNEKNSAETYISLTQIELNNTNIFAITKSSIIKKVKQNPYVEEVIVKRKLPNTVQISITERKATYQAQYNNAYIDLDKQGYVLETNQEKKDIITILGLNSTKELITQGQRVSKEDLLKLDTVLKIVNYCNYNTIENKITSIDVADISSYTIHFGEEGKIAYLGDDTKLNEKILRLKEILEREKGNTGEIFVTQDEIDRNRVYFKPSMKKE